jgi:hypothetical protein
MPNIDGFMEAIPRVAILAQDPFITLASGFVTDAFATDGPREIIPKGRLGAGDLRSGPSHTPGTPTKEA